MPYGYGFASMIGAQVLFFIITIALIFWVIKNSRAKDSNAAKEILNRRLASGEISTKEYDLMSKKINETG